MLDIIIQVLSVIGSILLVLVILLLILLVLILFYPVTYRFYGAKQEEITLRARGNWLFGLFRMCYTYPEPSRLTVKFLWWTLVDKKLPGGDEPNQNDSSEQVKSKINHAKDKSQVEVPSAKQTETIDNDSQQVTENDSRPESDIPETITEHPESNFSEDPELSFQGKISKKIEHIKYTILNVCDKIKNMWENIHYYIDLLKEDSTKALFSHVMFRVGSILKSIRPRHLKADIVFGTGSPDTTGYAYALYCMFAGFCGPKCIVVPDFEQKILKGELQFSGHISICVLLWNGLKVFFDKKLHLFIKKMKAGLPQKDSEENSKQNKDKRQSAERGK